MSEYMQDAGHLWMKSCDVCGGWFPCGAPKTRKREEEGTDYICEACTNAGKQIAALRTALMPFARVGKLTKPWEPDADAVICVADTRAALAVLEAQGVEVKP